jgi:tetratricopeptide (TPR) repeat protein
MRGLLAILLMWSLPARAEPFELELARAHFLTGQSYYEQARYADALKEFEEAHRLSRRPAFHFNIGVCHEKLGELDAAIASFERYLREAPEVRDRAEVEARVRTLQAQKALTGPPPEKRPKRAWLWGVIGGAAALVTAGVVVGVVLGTRDEGPRTLPDVRPQ